SRHIDQSGSEALDKDQSDRTAKSDSDRGGEKHDQRFRSEAKKAFQVDVEAEEEKSCGKEKAGGDEVEFVVGIGDQTDRPGEDGRNEVAEEERRDKSVETLPSF